MILAILQARTSSSRLPGKVLKPILGVPMLLRQIERIRRSRRIENMVLATSTDPSDDSIAKLSDENGVECFRGSLNDVLDRFYQAAKLSMPEHVVRLTGDCPLADPEIIDQVIAFYLSGNFDYASNTVPPSFPDGLDVEIFRYRCLEEAWKEARLPSQREHVTPFIHQHAKRFKLGNFASKWDLSSLRWTVDESLDLELVRKIYEEIYPQKPDFGTQDILSLLDRNPVLKTINTVYKRNEGYEASLAKDVLPAMDKKTGGR